MAADKIENKEISGEYFKSSESIAFDLDSNQKKAEKFNSLIENWVKNIEKNKLIDDYKHLQ